MDALAPVPKLSRASAVKLHQRRKALIRKSRSRELLRLGRIKGASNRSLVLSSEAPGYKFPLARSAIWSIGPSGFAQIVA